MSHYFEFTGFNLEDALENAMRELQISRKEFRYKVISDDEETLIRVYMGQESSEKKPYKKNPHLSEKGKHPVKKERYFPIEFFSNEVFLDMEKLEEQELKIQKILTLLKDILTYLSVTLDGFFIEERDEETYINLKCSEPAIIIGKQGAVLNSIQFLVGAHIPKILKELGQLDLPRKAFTIDVQGYRSKRLKILKEEVLQISEQVKNSGEAILLEGEFSPIERRQIHVYAQTLQGIVTESQGTGFLKPVLIKLA